MSCGSFTVVHPRRHGTSRGCRASSHVSFAGSGVRQSAIGAPIRRSLSTTAAAARISHTKTTVISMMTASDIDRRTTVSSRRESTVVSGHLSVFSPVGHRRAFVGQQRCVFLFHLSHFGGAFGLIHSSWPSPFIPRNSGRLLLFSSPCRLFRRFFLFRRNHILLFHFVIDQFLFLFQMMRFPRHQTSWMQHNHHQ